MTVCECEVCFDLPSASRPGGPEHAAVVVDILYLRRTPAGPAGIPTDHVLPDDPTCLPFIERYAADQQAFFQDFAVAYLQLANMGARWA